MAQYIPVYMDDGKDNYKNKGLYDIIVFIGEKSSNGKKELSRENAYKKGKKVINSRLNKWHLTAIERLVIADREKFAFDYEQKTTKPLWKIHRNKAKNIFIVIRCILRKYKNSEVLDLFDKICKENSFSTGTEAAGAPYYNVINDKNLLCSQNCDNSDIKALTKCAKKIEGFSRYYK